MSFCDWLILFKVSSRFIYVVACQKNFFLPALCCLWDLVPQLGIESEPVAVKALSPNYWTVGEFPEFPFYGWKYSFICITTFKMCYFFLPFFPFIFGGYFFVSRELWVATKHFIDIVLLSGLHNFSWEIFNLSYIYSYVFCFSFIYLFIFSDCL